MAKEKEFNEELNNENTEVKTVKETKSIFKDSGASDAQLNMAETKQKKKIVSKEKVDFVCEEIYAAIYPYGFESTYQGIPVYLIFDGRTVKLSPAVAEFVKAKIAKKAKNVAARKNSHANPSAAQVNLGSYQL